MWLLRVTLGEFDVFKERVKTDTISGDMPNVALFDANGRRIGFKNGEKHGKVKSGQGYDITVEPFESDNRKDPEYVTISASRSDAICIAAVTVTGADQGKKKWTRPGPGMVDLDSYVATWLGIRLKG